MDLGTSLNQVLVNREDIKKKALGVLPSMRDAKSTLDWQQRELREQVAGDGRECVGCRS